MAVTPQSAKKINKKGGTPQSAKQTGTPKSQKGSLPPTPESKSKVKSVTTPQNTKQSQLGTPNSQKSGKVKTPQSQQVKFKTPQLEKSLTPAAGKVPKADTPYPHDNKSVKKEPLASPVVSSPATNKKRKLAGGECVNSAEDDFEALLVPEKKLKIEDSPKKSKISASPLATVDANKQVTTPSKSAKKSSAQLKQSPLSGKKRQLEKDEDEDVSSDKADDSEEDEDSIKKAAKKRKLSEKPTAAKDESSAAGDQTSAIQLSAAEITKDLRLKEERDRRTLFLKKLPADVSETQVKALHSGILRVRFGESKWQKKSKKSRYAHIEFKDEKSAEEGLKSLTGKKIGEMDLIVDYVGPKSKNVPQGTSQVVDLSQLDPCKLFVSCYPLNTTAVDLKAVFPAASNIEFLVRRLTSQPLGYAFIHFKSTDECRKGHDAAQGKAVRGQPILVQYAKKSNRQQTNKGVGKVEQKQVSANGNATQEKTKSAVQQKRKQAESDDEEEDDEDDDESDEEGEDDESDDDEESDDDDDE